MILIVVQKSIDSMYSAYHDIGTYQNMQYQNKLTINGKEFAYYIGGYTNRGKLYKSSNIRDELLS